VVWPFNRSNSGGFGGAVLVVVYITMEEWGG
jgi:hypothetical protein